MTPISNRDKRTYSLQINDRFFSNFITETVDIRVSGEKVWSNFWVLEYIVYLGKWDWVTTSTSCC